MQDRHSDRKRYFLEQAKTTEQYVIPYVQEFIQFNEQTAVLEIGCGEGGNLLPFLDLGCTCVGVDIVPHRIENAKRYFEGHQNLDKLSLIAQDIYKADHLEAQFDFIFLRDVIEHIYDQDKFMGYVKRFLKPEGKIFLVFLHGKIPLVVTSKFAKASCCLSCHIFIFYQNLSIKAS